MKSKRGSSLVWIIVVILVILAVLLTIFVIIPLFKPHRYNLNVMLSAPLEGASASISRQAIEVNIRNTAPETLTIKSFHLAFSSPVTASCKKELSESLALASGMILPINAEDCEGFDLKKDTIDATVSITYTLQSSAELKTSTGKVWTSGPLV